MSVKRRRGKLEWLRDYLLKLKRDEFGGLDMAGSDGEGSRGNEMDASGMPFLPFIDAVDEDQTFT